MKKFAFTLEPVLEHRERVEDEKQRLFAERRNALKQAEAELAALNGRFKRYSDALRDGHRTLATEELRWHYAHLEYLDRRITMQHATISQMRIEVENARRELVAASKDRKVMEKLKERRRDEHRALEASLEQQAIDDANNRRQARAL